MSSSKKAFVGLALLSLLACSGVTEPAGEPEPVADAPPPPTVVTGTISEQDQTMPVRGAVAVLDAEARQIRFTLLPFTPTPEEVISIRKDRWIEVSFERDEYVVEGFPERIPRAELTLSWDEDEGLTEGSAHLFLNNFGRVNSNANLNWGIAKEHALTVETGLEPGGLITLTTTGEDTLFDERIGWDLQFSGPLEEVYRDEE